MKTIGIIGGGAAGLCSAHHVLLAKNMTPIVWEQSSKLGGTWVYTPEIGCDKHGLPIHSSMYKNLRTNLPKEVMAFPDFPFPDGDESFLHHTEVCKYLESYAEHFKLHSCIKFNHHVEKVTPVMKGDGPPAWEVIVQNLVTKESTITTCDALLICNGHYSVPRIPEIKDISRFKGKQTHSHDYREPFPYKDCTVVILGAAASGLDICLEVATVAKKVFLSHNHPVNIPSEFPVNVEQVRGVSAATENGFILSDGKFLEADVILYCTGYEFSFPFLSEECGITVEENIVKPLYKHLIHTNYPSMAFIGIPFQICPFPLFDFQIVAVSSIIKTMPPRRGVESLEHMCFAVMAQTIHGIAVELEETPEICQMSVDELSNMVASLPGIIEEKMINKVIETIHQTVKRTRRTIGMRTCLEVLLQPQIQRLDLSGLFFNMRLPGNINWVIRKVVSDRVGNMKNLTVLNMVSKCNDEILSVISKKCPNVLEVVVSISDLVTDEGLKVLVVGCPKLEKLGIYKCWEVTQEGIAYALQHAHNLERLQCDQLGSVMITRLRNSSTTFKLTHFEQTQTLFEPLEEDIAWVGRVCKNLESASLFVDDESLAFVPQLGNIKTLEIETSAVLGDGFLKAISKLGHSLTILQLSCDEVSQEKLVMLGCNCPHLATLHITTATVEGDERLVNPGNLFSSLTSLHLQVWKEAVISNECVEFFLFWCYKLESVVLKAEVEFFTDQYLEMILDANPLSEAKRIIIASDNHVPLTLKSAYRLLDSCPNLELLGISSWDVAEDEFFQIRNHVKNSNYNLAIS